MVPRQETRRGRHAPARLGAVAATVLAGVALAACSGGSGDSITLYNGQHPQTTAALVSAFERQTGITVNVRSGDEGALADQILAEGSHSPADVFVTENSPALWILQEHGLLAKTAASTLSQVPSRYSSPEGDWVAVTARVSVIVYNTDRLRAGELPRSVLQLAGRRWKGLVGLAAGETDFQPIVTAVERADGKSAALTWLQGLKDNAGGDVYPDDETLTARVNSGAAAIGVVNQYYWYRLKAQLGGGAMHSAIAEFAAGDPGYVVDVSGAAVLASSTHQAAAQRFLAFLVSEQGQEIIAHGDSFEYPLRQGVTTTAPEPPFGSLRPDAVSVGDLGDGSAAIALLQQVQLL
jgi:iron(III) transport system substrate-binding protein